MSKMQKPKSKKHKKMRHSKADVSFLENATPVPRDRHHKVRIDINDQSVNMSSLRLLCFKEKGIKCVTCGIEGKFLALEKGIKDKTYHVNMYALDQEGDEVLMTKDHIHPKSKGGKDHISNMQTMCKVCNEEKGNTI